MERVETLLQKLQQQFKDGAQPSQLLLTVQMLQYELMHLQHSEGNFEAGTMAQVSMPLEVFAAAPEVIPVPEKPKEEERTVEVLQVDEAEIEAELQEIKKKAASMQKISSQGRPHIIFNGMEDDDDVPTLPYREKKPANEVREINDTAANSDSSSINDKLKETTGDISGKLNESSIKDLRKAIDINDRFLFIRELFRGDEAMYERSIKTINSFSIYAEAEYWIRRELKLKLGWIDSDTVKQFDQLVKRRFA
jgi:hypothetical protein